MGFVILVGTAWLLFVFVPYLVYFKNRQSAQLANTERRSQRTTLEYYSFSDVDHAAIFRDLIVDFRRREQTSMQVGNKFRFEAELDEPHFGSAEIDLLKQHSSWSQKPRRFQS